MSRPGLWEWATESVVGLQPFVGAYGGGETLPASRATPAITGCCSGRVCQACLSGNEGVWAGENSVMSDSCVDRNKNQK